MLGLRIAGSLLLRWRGLLAAVSRPAVFFGAGSNACPFRALFRLCHPGVAFGYPSDRLFEPFGPNPDQKRVYSDPRTKLPKAWLCRPHRSAG
ncbi:unnamed protein product [Sphagnum troendelagicum]|uniref:Uncharacterized protein n=1 Tax=Sphagnum troendelagicum TaxID=128251 RepID=A0ABP0U5K4_9BRYO